jgi:hypothetical protein
MPRILCFGIILRVFLVIDGVSGLKSDSSEMGSGEERTKNSEK